MRADSLRGEVYMAHRVLPGLPARSFAWRGTTLTTAAFERFLVSKKGRRALPLSRLLEREKLPEDAWFLTFDDGYRDTLVHALPLLEKYGVPAAVFVTAGFAAGTHAPPEAALWTMLERARMSGEFGGLRQCLKHGSHAARMKRLAEIGRSLGQSVPPPEQDVFMTPGEVGRLAAHPLITVGAHSCTHPLLTGLWPWTLWREIAAGRKTLESWTGRPVRFFAYPYGGHHAPARLFLRLAGYKAAFTTAGTGLERARSFFALPRMEIKEEGVPS